MIKVLIVSATRAEIEPSLLFLEPFKSHLPLHYIFGKLEIEICITKVGMVNTAFELGRLNGKNFHLAINAGVAGCFTNLEIGTVVNVSDDCLSEFGAEDHINFLSADIVGLGEQKLGILNLLHNDITNKLPLVNGITVNTVHGNEDSIENIKTTYNPDVESMEGAAFIHAANAFNWKAVQLRAISNKVERRNKNNWNLPLAIKNLNTVLMDLIQNLNHSGLSH